MPNLPIHNNLPAAERQRAVLCKRECSRIAGEARLQGLEAGADGYGESQDGEADRV